MPWNKRTLAIPASPRSVRKARQWVTDVLREVGRAELVPAAQAGVSELVTNAILHAEPPVTVRVRGTVEHPRVEVTDQSLVPPQRGAAEDGQLTTFGRGIALVAAHAEKWGSDINFAGTGKTVWFEPSTEVHPPAEVPNVVFSLDDALSAYPGSRAEPDEMLPLELLGMPTQLFLALRNHFHEVGREVMLLALSESERYPEASELAGIFVQVEHERRQVRGLDDLEAAVRRGDEAVDLRYLVAPSAPSTMERAGALLERVYDAMQDEKLLAVRPAPELLALQRWYFGEFVRQADGEPPQRWDGPTRVSSGAWQTRAV